MINDWIDMGGVVLPTGAVIPHQYLTVNSFSGNEAIITVRENKLLLLDKGSLARDDDMSIMNTAPEIYNIAIGSFDGDISVDEYPGIKFRFQNNTLISIT